VAQLHSRALGPFLSPLMTRRDCSGVILARLHREPRVPPLLNGVLIGLLPSDGLRVFDAG
jgi:hypothetical protein